MEWFALSSKYYLDLDDQGVSEAAQTLLTRACGYIADNETSGFLPKAALKKLGLSRVSRRVDELIRVGIMCERSDGSGYDVPAWFKWNEPLERQVKKRKADRERIQSKREKEENVARQSRGVSRDVASPHRQRHIQETYVEEVSHVSKRASDETPSLNCSDHPNGTERPCHPCGEARRRHREWESAQKRALSERRSSEARAAAQLRAQAINACSVCDDDGYVGSALCGHVQVPSSRPSLKVLYQQAETEKRAQ